jgi:hypothetical protein
MSDKATKLNAQCNCISVDKQKLDIEVHRLISDLDLADSTATTIGSMLSSSGVFIDQAALDQMKALVKAVYKVCEMPLFQKLVLEQAPLIARHQQSTSGVFYGFDFHLGVNGPQLIEINTNAGGAMISALEIGASKNCCEPVERRLGVRNMPNEIYETFLDMFTQEWRSFNKDPSAQLKTIAIVDENPTEQFLYPEFQLFQALFQKHGITTIITSPDGLVIKDQKVYFGEVQIDLIYNRTTDFYFQGSSYEALRDAYLQDLVAITPNPFNHAVFANKDNLCILSNREHLDSLGVDLAIQEILLSHIPETVKVSSKNEESLWTNRKDYFFKPSQGYGSRAVYRGDKLTKGVWGQIKDKSYIAQKVIPPSKRTITIDGNEVDLKVDIRDYVFEGNSLISVSRIYQGQTTNLRTLGGGFSPLYGVD